MGKTKIQWTGSTWNPVTGCSKTSAGCANCYALTMAKRLKAMGQPKYRNEFRVTMHPDCLTEPNRWRKPRLAFVCSMADLFHADVTDAFIGDVFDVMRSTPKHTYQVLTKRPDRMVSFAENIEWPANVWAGVTIEANAYVERADSLREIPARVRFVSAEPLLDSLPDLDLTGIDQLIVGGESGRRSRPMNPEWVRDLRDRCAGEKVSFFFKQWGGVNKKLAGRELDGRTWDEMPQFGGGAA